MTVRYDAKRWASAPFSPTASSGTGATQEMHAYPLQPKEGLEDGGFEIEIIFWEKPKSNVCAFPIEDAQDLNFFDQPKPSAEEIPEGTVRPESVIGSHAVYHKTKVNHRVGDTIYATGKACHTYRPNEVPIGPMKFGQSSLWQGLVATPLVATLATEACAFGNSGLSAGTRKSTPWVAAFSQIVGIYWEELSIS